ncbi:hypothetical protein DAETH_06380 [Deinococcus aetherius]|uniref:DUF4393 domain-containing protein n=1 Tax=Deinococcus aetherius TaxID=200252 RepID=A0ABN6RCP2_9DEIO|nr:hypothetical protein [Deinococcus aetherius]BDP40669.1 hypothetical protein DAETH_06380 [Deinococcus aetherius]
MNALEPLLPVLQTLEPFGLPAAALQGWYAYANQRQAARLAKHLEYELNLVHQKLSTRVNHAYLRSDAFQANVVQAVRAAEMAESEDKLRFIARALAGCILNFPVPQLDKFQTMRIVEGMSDRELRVFVEYFQLLDPIDPYTDAFPDDSHVTVAGLTRQEFMAALLGLEQLGLLTKERPLDKGSEWVIVSLQLRGGEGMVWTLTPLARQVATLSRLQGDE